MEKFKIGYFASQKYEEQYIGGVMITDSQSIPLEFKYTEPIKPTRIHKIIFGKVLEKYISEEVIKKSLLKEIKNVPSLFFVTELDLLGEDTVNHVPMVALQTTSLPALNAAGEFQRVKDKEIIINGRSFSTRYDDEVARKLEILGHKNVKILDGGLSKWKKKGYPIES